MGADFMVEYPTGSGTKRRLFDVSMDLARRLGLLHAQLAHGAVRKATLTYKGDLAGLKTRLLTAAFTAGLLEYRLSEGVNLVNAEVLARDRGTRQIVAFVPVVVRWTGERVHPVEARSGADHGGGAARRDVREDSDEPAQVLRGVRRSSDDQPSDARAG